MIPGPRTADLPGDPNCPLCHGMGFLRQDLPLGHPDFGKIRVCECRHEHVAQQVRQRLFELSHLHELGDLTFENFQPRGRVGLSVSQARSLEIALNQSQMYAQNLRGWLVLQGGFGCGKTHLAAAIANFAVSVGVPTLFITVPDLLDSLRFAFNNPDTTFEARFEEIRTAPLLVMDDFGAQNASSWAVEKLFQILNYRYINHLPLVLTTNLDWRDFDERIASRLQDPELVTKAKITAPDFRNPALDMGDPELSAMHLLQKYTFATFDLRQREKLSDEELQNLQNVFQIAQQYAEHPNGWLVLQGGYGSGKTHLAAAIGHYRSDMGEDVTFVSVPDLMDHLRATFNPNSSISLDRRFEQVRFAQFLILDDMSTESASPWAREKLYQLINHRYNAELPTVITTAHSLKEIDPRLRSRLMDTRLVKVVGLMAPPYTGKITNGDIPVKAVAKKSKPPARPK